MKTERKTGGFHSNRAKNWWNPNKTFKIINDALSLMVRDINCDERRQNTFI